MDKALEMDFLLNYPAVVSDGPNKFEGYVTIHDVSYPVKITQTKKSEKVSMHIKRNSMLEPYYSELSEYISQNNPTHPVQLLHKIVEIIKTRTTPQTVSFNVAAYRAVISEYIEFINFFINLTFAKISEDLSRITVKRKDAKNRVHQVEIDVNLKNDGKLFKISWYDLPKVDNWDGFEEENSLIGLYEKFWGLVDCTQNFMDLMDEIDSICWVLDPYEPKRSDLYRRIAITERTSMVVTFNSLNVHAMPDIKFLGPKSETAIFVEKLNNNLLNDEINCGDECDVMEEILKLIGLSRFPAKPVANENTNLILVDEGECSICFSFRLEGKSPEVICSNNSCNHCYHTMCLYQWLSTVITRTRRFNVKLSGNCPNCEKMITCPIPDKQYKND